MEILQNLMLGFSVAVSPSNLLHALIGVLLGTLIGCLEPTSSRARAARFSPRR